MPQQQHILFLVAAVHKYTDFVIIMHFVLFSHFLYWLPFVGVCAALSYLPGTSAYELHTAINSPRFVFSVF